MNDVRPSARCQLNPGAIKELGGQKLLIFEECLALLGRADAKRHQLGEKPETREYILRLGCGETGVAYRSLKINVAGASERSEASKHRYIGSMFLPETTRNLQLVKRVECGLGDRGEYLMGQRNVRFCCVSNVLETS